MTAAKPVVSTLFGRGTFTAGDSAATAAAIAGAARRRDFRDITQHGRGLTLPDRFGQGAAMASMLTPELAGGALRGGVQPDPRTRDGGPAPVQRVRTAAGAALQVLGRRSHFTPALLAGRARPTAVATGPPHHAGGAVSSIREERGTVAESIRPVTTMRGPMKGAPASVEIHRVDEQAIVVELRNQDAAAARVEADIGGRGIGDDLGHRARR